MKLVILLTILSFPAWGSYTKEGTTTIMDYGFGNHEDERSYSDEFRCDGRTHCSQMRSYKEAKFFLRNCPNTKMDGDRDGKPCERHKWP